MMPTWGDRWEDTAFVQETLLRDLGNGGYFAELVDGYQEHAFPGLSNQPNGSGVFRALFRSGFERAEPWYVSPEMFEVYDHAYKSFAPEPVHRTDLVCPCGFALLPRPIMLPDVAGRTVSFRAILWLPVSALPTNRWDDDVEGQGVFVALLTHRDDAENLDDDVLTAARERGWEWGIGHASVMG